MIEEGKISLGGLGLELEAFKDQSHHLTCFSEGVKANLACTYYHYQRTFLFPTLDRARLPAEFKDMTKRRKRNYQGFSQ